MIESVQLLSLRVEEHGKILNKHLEECAAQNKRLGERLWQVCVIILGALGSLLVYDITSHTSTDSAAAQAVAVAQDTTSIAKTERADEIAKINTVDQEIKDMKAVLPKVVRSRRK